MARQGNPPVAESLGDGDAAEFARALHIADDNDRSDWMQRVFESYPEILELTERVNPLYRAVSFGQTYNIGRSEVKQALSRKVIVQLILQHLQFEGLKQSKKSLEEESHIRAVSTTLKESALIYLMRDAIRDTEKAFEYVISDREKVDGNSRIGDLIEQLLAMGVEDDVDDEEDVNIWEDEGRTDDIILADDDGGGELQQIKAASLNKLVERLSTSKGQNLQYMRTFLLTYQSFCKPDRLLQKLIQRYHVPKPDTWPVGIDGEEQWKNTIVKMIQLRVGSVLVQWVKRHFTDFNDRLIMNLNMFVDNTLSRDGHEMLANQLRSLLSKKIAGDSGDNKKVMFSEPPPDPKVPKNIFSPTLKWYEVEEEEIARQMTLIEFKLYSSIKPSELLNQAWNKAKLKHRAPNVLAIIHRFNQVSLWVAATIVRTEKVKARTKIMSRFITLAQCLRDLNNYNACMSIIAGMNNAAVHRLNHTKNDLPKKSQDTFVEMEALLSRKNNSKVYREVLHNSNPPCIPYLGVYLTDLTFIEDGNPDLLRGLINFKKRALVSNVILEMQQYQLRPYNLLPVHQIASFLSKFSRVDEQELYRISLVREPRNADREDIV